jgi:predicted GNAT superfamily acetyltransferase
LIVIRACSGLDELEACVQLQIETWGYDPTDVLPRKSFLLAQKIGGQVIGAFDTELDGADPEGGPESLVGFVMAWPGVKAGGSVSDGQVEAALAPAGGNGKPRAYLHSHMLAVREGYRNRGLGVRLKLAQRADALARGIRHMEWTFDPLEIKNAYLNIHKLGAIVRRYEVNFYGVSSSRLQGGLPTDRLVAEWQLDSPRVEAVVEDRPAAALVPIEQIETRICVPASIYEWKASEAGRERALAIQMENRGAFLEAFSQGLAVVGFALDAHGNGMFELALTTESTAALNSKERKNL